MKRKMRQQMDKPEYVKVAEEDMDFEADQVVKDLCDYAEENCIECDFIFETFLKAFHKKVKTESEEK